MNDCHQQHQRDTEAGSGRSKIEEHRSCIDVKKRSRKKTYKNVQKRKKRDRNIKKTFKNVE